jgi:putative addiction module CopG family antidote
MNMRIVLDKKTQKFIAERVSAGAFKSPSELVKKGVELIRASETPKMTRLEKAIKKGLDDHEAGRYVTLQIHEIKDYMRGLREKALGQNSRKRHKTSRKT